MEILNELYKEIKYRKKTPQEGSYTSYLFSKGLDKILKKVGEETTEVVIAAKNDDKEEIIAETADLLYHLTVMLVEKKCSLEDLEKELKKRQGKISKTNDRRDIIDL